MTLKVNTATAIVYAVARLSSRQLGFIVAVVVVMLLLKR